ncbi:hypothetical protein [Marinilabilia rubra]|uniref:Uncharacterized protein n=1 Tax=Marinilabilia rubra TaxID=2162893 RepID=A0A2U2BAD9_9BACT|nr:hypothetical protein [Marinilabilia rubra]PWE00031.1 hypothetical protein DDZ16_06610 [Marinilabilia rubra]
MKKNTSIPVSAPTFQDFVLQNIRNSTDRYTAEIVLLQLKIEDDIQLMELESSDFIKHETLNEFDTNFLHENWQKFINLFESYIHTKPDLPEWLQKNCQEHYSETLSLIREKILSQFVNILEISKFWEEYFQNDKIFKLGLRSQSSHAPQFIKEYSDLFFKDNPPIQDFIIQINSKSTVIAFKTIFRLFILEKIIPTRKEELLKEIQRRISTQNEVILQSLNNEEEIPGLIKFYEKVEAQLKQIKIPKFHLHNKEKDFSKFKDICKDFSRAPKLFAYKIEELLDLVDQESEQGLVFDIDPQKKELFYIFIDTIKENAIVNKNTVEVIENRFTIGGSKIKNFTRTKSDSLKVFFTKLKVDSKMNNLKYQLLRHKYLCHFLNNFKKTPPSTP